MELRMWFGLLNALVILLFLLHVRASLVVAATLPVAVLLAFIGMQQLGVDANIMSLSGIAIAIGAMVDAAIVMIENAHKHLERYRHEHGTEPVGGEHWRVVTHAASEVGPALFFSLLIITLSFLPVFTLQAQEGRLFRPLAYTKTFAMAAASVLAITIILCFRSVRWVLIPIAVVQLTLLLTQAVLVWSRLQLSMVSSMLTAIVTVVGIATVMHVIVRFRDARQAG